MICPTCRINMTRKCYGYQCPICKLMVVEEKEQVKTYGKGNTSLDGRREKDF